MTVDTSVVASLPRFSSGEPLDLARAALVVAKIEYPQLDPGPTLDDARRARRRAPTSGWPRWPARPCSTRVAALNRLLFDDEGFAGNRRTTTTSATAS